GAEHVPRAAGDEAEEPQFPAPHGRVEPDGEALHAHTDALRREEVPRLVDEDDDADPDERVEDVEDDNLAAACLVWRARVWRAPWAVSRAQESAAKTSVR